MHKIYSLLFVLITTASYSQYSKIEAVESDSLKTTYLDELVISANKIPETRRDISQQITTINPGYIKIINAPTVADLLQSTGSVFVQRSQQGGGSPVLRGFEASKVLLMIDGVRINNAIYRAGHLQNVITIDNNMLSRVEVLMGPSSSTYGSDAFGGVVHFYTLDPELSLSKRVLFHANTFGRYATVNNEKTGHFDLSIANHKIGYLASLSMSDFGDLKMGKKINPALGEEFGLRSNYVIRSEDNTTDILETNPNKYVQKNSGYKQYDLLQKLLFKPNDRCQHIINFQFSTSSNIPRYDRLTVENGDNSLKYAQWYYGPQKRLLISYNYQIKNLGVVADKLSMTLSYQNVEESRHSRNFDSQILGHQFEKVKVFALTVDLSKALENHTFRYGFDSQFNQVASTANNENIVTNEITKNSTRYPDGSNSLNFLALYGSHFWHINKYLRLSDGIRFGSSSLKSRFIDKTFFPFPFDNINQKLNYLSGNLGLTYLPGSWKLSVFASTGFRVPNIDDISKVFESQVGTSTTLGTLIVPNPNVKPEKIISVDFSVSKFFAKRARLEGVFFISNFFDAIIIQPTSLNGKSTVIYNGYEANVVSSQNASRGYLFGFNLSGQWDFFTNFAVSASYNYTHGRIKNFGAPDTPLDHIPPTFGKIGLNYSHNRLKIELFSIFNGWKKIEDYNLNGEDNLPYATSKGMPSWITYNVRFSYELKKIFDFQIGIDNALNLQYRTFASGINSPGRNFFFTVRAKI